VANTVSLLARTLGERIPIRVDLAADLWPVLVDPAQLEASLVNLATNARDAMPHGGELTIATANRMLDGEYAAGHAELAPGDYVMIEVSDTGTGIPPEVMARVFEPFFTTKELGKGTGLGLSMVFGFVKQSGGHINVYSELGKGTTFRLYLRRAEPVRVQSPEQPQAAPAEGGSETILVVEDNDGIRRAVRRQLVQLGYQVIEAETATAALEVLGREKVVLLFSDIVMPGAMDGIELVRTAMARWPELKVLLTSGFPESRISRNGETLAGLRLLSKPYRRDELARALREALDGDRSGGER
jgi:CheY-like chemotaxis protein